ncbi:unnamed protein product [Vitrella brassicaformis CCMP3155]|uniref:Protein kinase domain-containing protein n=1 Tax=Vitrella brassicaformis (strain CCMP3155) TaxID=1169540 RepID=A0A0G4ETB5_VITBC|nr:unnamed protein product [Vitrella brassicaformis CCMP3155]|eukprot:CEM01482.1 unnamed protein product [Vitrella brassicaformis CCMP3155]
MHEADFMGDVQREISIMEAAKDIPGVAELYAVDHFAEVSYLETDMLPGGSLLYRLEERHRDEAYKSCISEDVARQWMTPVIQKGIYHGDQHLDKILFDAKNMPKLIDFDNAPFFDPKHGGLVYGGEEARGVRFFMAPETLCCYRVFAAEKATVFSLGRMLRLLMDYGHNGPRTSPPSAASPLHDLFIFICDDGRAGPFYRDISADMKALIGWMTANDPLQRPTTAAVLQHPWSATFAIDRSGLGCLLPAVPHHDGAHPHPSPSSFTFGPQEAMAIACKVGSFLHDPSAARADSLLKRRVSAAVDHFVKQAATRTASNREVVGNAEIGKGGRMVAVLVQWWKSVVEVTGAGQGGQAVGERGWPAQAPRRA